MNGDNYDDVEFGMNAQDRKMMLVNSILELDQSEEREWLMDCATEGLKKLLRHLKAEQGLN